MDSSTITSPPLVSLTNTSSNNFFSNMQSPQLSCAATTKGRNYIDDVEGSNSRSAADASSTIMTPLGMPQHIASVIEDIKGCSKKLIFDGTGDLVEDVLLDDNDVASRFCDAPEKLSKKWKGRAKGGRRNKVLLSVETKAATNDENSNPGVCEENSSEDAASFAPKKRVIAAKAQSLLRGSIRGGALRRLQVASVTPEAPATRGNELLIGIASCNFPQKLNGFAVKEEGFTRAAPPGARSCGGKKLQTPCKPTSAEEIEVEVEVDVDVDEDVEIAAAREEQKLSSVSKQYPPSSLSAISSTYIATKTKKKKKKKKKTKSASDQRAKKVDRVAAYLKLEKDRSADKKKARNNGHRRGLLGERTW